MEIEFTEGIVNNLIVLLRMECMAELTDWGYGGLFLLSFLAGSVLPFSSELGLTGMIAMGYNPLISTLLATLGNWLGGVTCYGVGYLGRIDWMERYFGVKHQKILKMQAFLQGKGAAMAFFSFVPFVGDVLIIALGYMRANFGWVIAAMFVGKLLRYIAVAQGSVWIIGS